MSDPNSIDLTALTNSQRNAWQAANGDPSKLPPDVLQALGMTGGQPNQGPALSAMPVSNPVATPQAAAPASGARLMPPRVPLAMDRYSRRT
jgi:hypothetical protein